MNWIHVLTIVGVNIAIFGALATLIIYMLNKLDGDIKSLGNRVDNLGNRVDGLSNRLDGHAMRIDQLYNMFVSLLKDSKK